MGGEELCENNPLGSSAQETKKVMQTAGLLHKVEKITQHLW